METTWEDIIENTWEIFHLGPVVRDVDKTFDYYQSLGLISSLRKRRAGFTERTVEEHGKPRERQDYPTKARIFRMGPLPFEMLEYNEDSKAYNKEFLDSKGEGIAHIGFIVDDLEAETAKLVEKGIPIILTGRVENRVNMHYFDTRKFGGFALELLQKGTWGDFFHKQR